MSRMSLLCKTKAYSIVFPTVFFSLSQIAIHSVLPQVIVELVCSTDNDEVDCDSSDVSRRSSLVNLMSSCIINIPCIFLIGFYASFASKYGLKPTLLSPVIGNFLFLSCIAISRHSKFHFSVIMFGSLLSGISGGRNSFMMATFAYAADVSSPQERSKVFSVIESSMYCAKIFCPFTIGILSKKYGFGVSLLMGMSFCFLNVIWIIFVMKDPIIDFDDNYDNESADGMENVSQSIQIGPLHSASKILSTYDEDGIFNNNENKSYHNFENNNYSNDNRDNIHHSSNNLTNNSLQCRTVLHSKLAFHPFATFHSVNKLWGKKPIGNSTVPFVSGVYFLNHMIAVGVHVVEILFMKYKMNWDSYNIGLFGSMHGLMEIFSMLLAPLIAAHLLGLEMTDIKWIEVGLWAKSLFFLLFGLATNSMDLFIILFLLILCGPVVPRIRSYLSKSVNSHQQNELFAALAALDAVSAFASPAFTAIYLKTVSYYPGFVFEIVSFLFLVSALVILFVRREFGRFIFDYSSATATEL